MDKIETVEDQEKLIIQNSIKYMDQLTRIGPLNLPTLKSLYRTKVRLMELRQKIFLPDQKRYSRCQCCFMDYSEGDTKFEVQPAKLSSFAKQVIAKAKKEAYLTDYQKAYYKKLLKKFPNGFQDQNKLIQTCSHCKKKSVVWMDKPIKKTLAKKKPPKKKKKLKTDKFCGLNQSIVTSTKAKKPNQLDVSNAFMAPEQSNLNATVSMTNTRGFGTAPLKKVKQKIKLSSKKTTDEVPKPIILPFVARLNEKLKNKNRKSLNNILQKAVENNNVVKSTTKLKDFLASI
ncbi:unnamed protein product [Ceutorhynchus assimilis]|uniref:Uncharacterized protein n=1 Tax=Ceutorhynchus assimilis TaxID=467358 RepID=A0A9N9QF51_9CUCU|nr:unnamed protein product [Ceutorhynchus assimilis]